MRLKIRLLLMALRKIKGCFCAIFLAPLGLFLSVPTENLDIAKRLELWRFCWLPILVTVLGCGSEDKAEYCFFYS